MKKAIINDPYLDTSGGGERYCLTVAECLLQGNWQVDVLWDDKKDLMRAIKRLNLRLEKTKVIGQKVDDMTFWQRTRLLRNYDLCFWLSDGSVPLLTAKKNILHFQRPFLKASLGLKQKIKLKFVDHVVCNSKFTRKHIDQEFSISSKVLYPPVDIKEFSPGKKENIILAVGRFDESSNSKRQDLMIDAFKQMVDQGLKDWSFVLIGGSLSKEKNNKLVQRLRKLAKGYPVKLLVNASFERLKKYYAMAKIFWHAKGWGVNVSKEPWKTEHFGITPVEAMAAGVVPVVVDKGGLPEIVRRGVGEKWESVKELQQKTLELINNHEKLEKYSNAAQSRSLQFSKSKFCENLMKIVID